MTTTSRSIDCLLRLSRISFAGLLRSSLLIIGISQTCDPLQAADLEPWVQGAGGRANHLPTETLREIFFMRLTTWPDGSRIRVFVLPDSHPLHASFAKQVLGVYPFQLRAAWDRLIYSGTGVSPTVVETIEEMQERIRTTPGSIGYISK